MPTNLKYFHVQLTVFCSACPKWEYIDSKTSKEGIKECIKRGWMLNKDKWLCGDCGKKKNIN